MDGVLQAGFDQGFEGIYGLVLGRHVLDIFIQDFQIATEAVDLQRPDIDEEAFVFILAVGLQFYGR